LSRVARWYIFEPKIPIWVKFGDPLNGKILYLYFMPIRNIFCPFGIVYEHLIILWLFAKFFPILVYCVKKNLATLEACNPCRNAENEAK
jgi:hypothetical protein